jgi:V-type H+-transporting ATPase subunit E
MSQIHSMSDSQVDTELRKMTAFIRQEALEKAREIHLKADEEFSIEKSKLVRQETQRIDAEYEKKHTQAGMSQQITASTLANRQRLRVLASKQELLDGLFEQAGKKLAETVGAGKKGKKGGAGADYESVLKGLVLEGLYALVESKISIRCRKKDVEVVKKAIEGAKKEYSENLKGREVEVTVDEKENLPEES